MNEHEIQRIADAINRLRPDWPTKQLTTLLASTPLASRPRRDVGVALAWVALEPDSSSPYRVLEAGPWWQAAAVEGTTAPRYHYDPNASCAICSLPEPQCTANPHGDHDYVTVNAHQRTIRSR